MSITVIKEASFIPFDQHKIDNGRHCANPAEQANRPFSLGSTN